ncbi:MAG: choice-of-anchor X domain-containing protein, partial [Candidatus Methanoperedens sp.]
MWHKVEEDSVKCRDTIAITVRVSLLFLVIIAALFATAQTAEAAGVPTKLIVFTDKKVYTDAYNSPRTTETNTGQISPGAGFTEDFRMIVYAIILDDEGNILSGNQSINFTARTVDDVKKLDHGPITSTAVHHDTITNNPTILDGQITFPALRDDGTNFDTYANDGIYTALINLPDYSVGGATKAKNWAVGTSTLLETNAHLLVDVNVTFNNGINPLLNATTSVLFTQYNCHQTAEGDHPNAHVGNDGAATTFEPCNICHIGYDHLYNYKNFSEFPSDFGDVAHANKLQPPAALGDIVTANTADIVYNTTYGGNTEPQWQITSWSVFLNQGDTSNYCYVCHFNPGSLPLDYGSGAARTDLSDRPSCSVASKSLRGGTANVGCHATTNITATDIIPWNQSAANTTHMLLGNLTAAKSHNHSTSTANLPCAGCHLTIHSLVLPNKTSDNNINNQCKYCHSNTGPQNSPKLAHSSTTTDCKQCHKNATGALDAHLVPEGLAGGVNCTECHNVGGSVNNVNFTTVGKGMHANLNKNASSSPQNATNKPCWACHGTINATSGLANYSDQPADSHNQTVYKSPRKCEDCHITGKLWFNATNVTDHIPSGYSSLTDVNTSSYNYTVCTYCHNNSVNYSNDTSMGLTVNGNPINASVSHYGANKTANTLMSAANDSTDCAYCHRNNSNMLAWGILNGSTANITRKNGTAGTGINHTPYTASIVCKDCHGAYNIATSTFHNASISNGSDGGPNCIGCHYTGSPYNDINITAFNQSTHFGMNSVNSSANGACWACHDTVGNVTSGHGDKQKTPKVCGDCHLISGTYYTQSQAWGGLRVDEHYYGGIQIKAGNSSSNLTS